MSVAGRGLGGLTGWVLGLVASALLGAAACTTPAAHPAEAGAPDAGVTPSGAGGSDAGADKVVTSAAGSSADAVVDTGTIDSNVGATEGGPDAFVRNEGGPFGIATRAAKQLCNPPAPNQPPALLSATGCVDATDPKKPAPSLIPYEVNSPLWSDGADKQRFLAIPDGAVIHVKDCTREPATCKPLSQGGTTVDEGHWTLPVGTVLVKSFLFGGKFVETRLFVRYSDMWVGFSYRWNAAQTDAMLVSQDGDTATITNSKGGMQTWTFPSQTDCVQCHNDTVGGSLGLETRQLDRTMKYPSGTTANQLNTLEHLGLFDAPIPRLAPPLSDYMSPTAPDSAEAKTRSYLHANCAICHRPDGAYSAIDLRFGVPLAQMNVCNVAPNKGDQGVTGALRLFAGSPAKSLMVLRMQAPDMKNGRMPNLASSVLDPTGIGLVSNWIKATTTCP